MTDDDLCEECEKSAVLMFLNHHDYCDGFYCYDHALLEASSGFLNRLDANRKLEELIEEGTVVEL